MAFTKTSVTSSAWVLIANNKTSLSVYNVGQNLVYLAFTAANVAPTETVGLPLDQFSGISKATITNLSHVGSAAYVWARSAGGGSSVVAETN